jgi:hypothetical protein
MDSLKTRLKNTAFVRLYALTKIPLIALLLPEILEMGKSRTEIKIALRALNKNHLGTMYFGALAMGAELVVAAKAVQAIYDSKQKVDFVFKDFSAQFLKRADGHVHFICEQGEAVDALIAKAIESGQREEQTFSGFAVVPSKSLEEKIMTSTVTLSVKKRQAKKA